MAQGTVKSLVSTLNSNLSNKIVVEQKGISNSDEITTGGVKHFEIPVSKTGYEPIGIVGISGSGNNGLVPQEYYMSGTTAHVYMRNVLDRSLTPANIRAFILYSKNS